MSTLLHLICDYGANDLAFAEIIRQLSWRLPADVRFWPTSVDPFDTTGTGFVLGQLALGEQPPPPFRTIVFANCAPRKDRTAARKNNAGEGLLYGRLRNGVEIIAVNSGNTFGFVKHDLSSLFTTIAPNRGSQFRSRDFFPKIIAAVINGQADFTERELTIKTSVPDMPQNVVAYRDSFGNLKTSIRDGNEILGGLSTGQRVKVTIGRKECTATVATGSFNVKEGDLALAPGSSGYEKRFWELFKRGGSAWRDFNCPDNGDVVTIHAE